MAVYRDAESMLAAIGSRLGTARAAVPAALAAAGAMIAEEAKSYIGSYQPTRDPDFPAWAPLTPQTQAERVRLGYSPDDPLLRSGALRDAIEVRVAGFAVSVGVPATPVAGSNATLGEIASWMEWGTATVPRRPFLLPAAFGKRYAAIELVWATIQEALR